MAAIAVALALGALPAGAAAPGLQHVAVIGDSVADGISGDPRAVKILQQGVDLDLETAACRRVDGTSCPHDGADPPTVVDLAHSLGAKLGANVVVAVGYNDFEDQYAQNIETALAAFKAEGVQHVWWLTLRAARHPYLSMNEDIRAAAQNHPELSVVDWNVYSRSHPDWFQPDGLHLLAPGSEAMATLIHQTLLQAHVVAPPPRILTAKLPAAHRGHAYRLRLHAASGVSPYRWSLLERAPSGLHLTPAGLVEGKPRAAAGLYEIGVRVTDSAASSVVRTLTLRIAG
jgi:hypothetical protein